MIPVVIALAELCTPVPPAESRDPTDAAAYARAGDDARSAGDLRIAALAYRKAIALDGANTHARDALAALCAEPAAGGGLVAAIARFRDGDLDAARAAFSALVAGDETAAAGAHFFLGVIALRTHDGPTATHELELATRDPAYADAAAPLLRLAHRDGALAALVIAEPEFDTNPQLVPETPPVGATLGPPRADESLLLAATITARPWPWLAIRDVFAWRKQRELSTLDFIGENAEVALELDAGVDHVAVRYDLDYDFLDGESYLTAHKGTAMYRRDLGPVALGASYSLRRRVFMASSFTGWVHAADAGAVVHASPQVDLDVRAVGWREQTADAAFSDLAGGLQLALRARPHDRVRLTCALAAWYAHYDVAQPDGLLRNDTHLEAGVDVEIDLGDHVIAVGGASVARNDSTIEDFRYWKVLARAGVAFAVGGL